MDETTKRMWLLAQLVASAWMLGLIWFVQIVHYPLYAAVGSPQFAAYEQRHTQLTTWVVGPAMLVEAASALLLVWCRPRGVSSRAAWFGLVLVAVIWLSTAALQVPCHDQLVRGFDADVHRRLVVSNWIRTTAWSCRTGLLSWLVWNMLQRRDCGAAQPSPEAGGGAGDN